MKCNNPARDRYSPPTGYALGQRVIVERGAAFCFRGPRSGVVMGFGNPEITPVPSVRVRFNHVVRKAKRRRTLLPQGYTYELARLLT